MKQIAEAVEQNFLTKDPARNIALRLTCAKRTRLRSGGEQLRNALSRAARSYLAGARHHDALRPSELFALRWELLQVRRIHNEAGRNRLKKARCGHGARTRQGWFWCTCRRSSRNTSALETGVSRPFTQKRSSLRAKGRFMSTGNYRKRVLHKLARELELPKLTFEVIRRTIPSHARAEERNRDLGTFTAFTSGDNYRRITCKRSRTACTVNAIDRELRVRRENLSRV